MAVASLQKSFMLSSLFGGYQLSTTSKLQCTCCIKVLGVGAAPPRVRVASKNFNPPGLHADRVSPGPLRLAFLAKDTQKPSYSLIQALRAAISLRSTHFGEFFGDARESRMRMKLGMKSGLRSEIATNDNDRVIKVLTLGCVKLGDLE